MMSYPDTRETRQAIIDACLQMNARGINQSTSGNISVRTENGILITPSGIPYERLKPDMIVSMDLAGEPRTGQIPSSEWRFHQRLLAARPEMTAVVHAHPPYCTVLAVQRRTIPACHYMVAAFGGDHIPMAGYALFGSWELAEELVGAMGSHHACLMANHGATVVGESLDRALWRLEELEVLARTYYLSEPGGKAVLLSAAEMSQASVSIANYGRKPDRI